MGSESAMQGAREENAWEAYKHLESRCYNINLPDKDITNDTGLHDHLEGNKVASEAYYTGRNTCFNLSKAYGWVVLDPFRESTLDFLLKWTYCRTYTYWVVLVSLGSEELFFLVCNGEFRDTTWPKCKKSDCYVIYPKKDISITPSIIEETSYKKG